MAILEKEKNIKASGTRSFGRGHLPTKRSINLAGVTEKRINWKAALPAIVLIVAAAAVFSKFCVADRLSAVSQAKAEVRELQSQLDAGYEKLSEFGSLEERYAHYTYSGMSQEELSRADRAEVMDLINRVVLPSARVDSWAITSNQLTMTLTGKTLQDINAISQMIEAEEAVDFCTVTTAATTELARQPVESAAESDVTANVIVYLKSALREGAIQ